MYNESIRLTKPIWSAAAAAVFANPQTIAVARSALTIMVFSIGLNATGEYVSLFKSHNPPEPLPERLHSAKISRALWLVRFSG